MDKIVDDANNEQAKILRVTVAGGGPVGLTFALLLEHLMGNSVLIKVYDTRWSRHDPRVVWKSELQGNARRQQVVTLQSRQYLKLPKDIQDRIFKKGYYSEMWPIGPDSIKGYAPRNVRIAHIEDRLLDIANTKTQCIKLIPERFQADEKGYEIENQHLLVICEGGRSRTRDFFINKFGNSDKSMYSLDAQHLQDVVLGLRVKSDLPDPTAVILTVAQNRFLLNSLRGEGFLNMRLTDEEIEQVKGIDPQSFEVKDCIQSQPCLMQRSQEGAEFRCATHGTVFLPAIAMLKLPLWPRVLEGLRLFGIEEENLTAVTAFRLDLVQRPRFTAQLYPPTEKTPGTFGCLLGDAANAIHFWPGRGLNSGIASAVSLARCLHSNWRGRKFRDADFFRHEGIMSMLQYRQKSRAWHAMVTTESDGTLHAIKSKIKQGIDEAQRGNCNRNADINELMIRFSQIKQRLEGRIRGQLPDDDTLRQRLENLNDETLRVLVLSDSWNTASMGGEEVEVDLLFEEPDLPVVTGKDPKPLVPPESLIEWVEISEGELWIAKVPITNAQYQKFIKATNYPVPQHWRNDHFPNHKKDHPVVNVSWYDAQEFCKWAKVVLPTDAEWKKAATGPSSNDFPLPVNRYPNDTLCNYNSNVGDTTPVNKYPNGCSEYNIFDMAGNVWEWTADINDLFIETNGEKQGNSKRSLRGGCFSSSSFQLCCNYKISLPQNEKRETIGFRVAFRNQDVVKFNHYYQELRDTEVFS